MQQPIFLSAGQQLPLSAAGYPHRENTSADAGSGPSDKTIDLNDQLVKNKLATYFLRVHSDAMIDAGIRNGDVVIVDRSLEPQNGAIVIAALQGELVIRRYESNNGKISLVPACKQLSPVSIPSFTGFAVWGVVTYVIRSM